MKENITIERKIRAYIRANRIFIKIRQEKESTLFNIDPINNCPFNDRHNYCHYMFPEWINQMEELGLCPCELLSEELVLSRTKEIMDKV